MFLFDFRMGFRGDVGCLDSPHFIQLCPQISRYFFSLLRTASAALLHNMLGSLQPASWHNLDMKVQQSWASFWLNVTRLVRTSRQSSLAKTQVLMNLNLLRTCSRILWRLNSIFFSPIGESNYLSDSFILWEFDITTFNLAFSLSALLSIDRSIQL